MPESIKMILMRRDGMTDFEADELIEEAKEAFFDYLNNGEQDLAENVCEEYFNLEPDYLDQLWD